MVDETDLLHVDTLCRRWLQTNQHLDECIQIPYEISASKRTFPMGAWTTPALSTRNSTRPAFISFTACSTLKVTVPTFGLGIRPRGPRIRPMRPTTPIISGVGDHFVEVQPALVFDAVREIRSPTKSAPAALASVALSPLAKTATRTAFPQAHGDKPPRHGPSGPHGEGSHLSSRRHRRSRRTFTYDISLTSASASLGSNNLSRSIFPVPDGMIFHALPFFILLRDPVNAFRQRSRVHFLLTRPSRLMINLLQ